MQSAHSPVPQPWSCLPDASCCCPFQELASFLLSAEAAELRPLVEDWLSGAADLLLRDRLRKAVARLRAAAQPPRLPFPFPFPALPAPPPPPIFVPGRGFLSLDVVVDELAPALNDEEQVYLQSLTELTASLLGVPVADLLDPSLESLGPLLSAVGIQLPALPGLPVPLRSAGMDEGMASELAEALSTISGSPSNLQVR